MQQKENINTMLYRYETHCHCSQCSACSRSTSQELVRAYHKAGFAGMVLTDHFVLGNSAVDRSLPWEEQMKCQYQPYLDAKEVGDSLDFDVIFGIEHAYGDGKELLFYGIDLNFLLSNPDIPEISVEELVARVKSYGGIVVQAHPYRNRWYVNMEVGPRADLIDGVEVYNSCNQPGEDKQALALAKSGSFLMTCGGDIHRASDPRLGMAGIALPYRIRNEKELVSALKSGDCQYIIGGNIIKEIREADLP